MKAKKIKIGVVDKDNGPLAEGLVKWLEGTHHVTMLEDNREKLQEELFYRNVEYIVVIPEDFYENCMVNGESISVTKVPGSYSAYYVDQQLESCLNTMRTYLKAGFSQKEAATAILDEKRGEVTMLDTDENSGTSGWLYYFRYIPYLFLALLCYVMGYVLMAFQKKTIYQKECRHLRFLQDGRVWKGFWPCLSWAGAYGESVWLEPSLCMENHFSVQKILNTMY